MCLDRGVQDRMEQLMCSDRSVQDRLEQLMCQTEVFIIECNSSCDQTEEFRI